MNDLFPNAFSLKGRRALITGGATGLGLAMARCMTAAGADVVAIGRAPKEKLSASFADLGPKASYYSFDITDTDRTPELVNRIITDHGAIDILVNNAGVHCKKPVEDTTVQDFTRVLNVHLVGSFALTKVIVPHMRANKSGSILFISSMTGFIGLPYVTAYAAAKSGVLGMVRTLSSEISPDGVRVNAIVPGFIETPMFHQATDGDPARQQKILSRTPMKKYGTPMDIGWAAVYLCSPAASFITGTALTVDGGAVIGF